jgi:nitrate reductase assembly molybdenum cofactor insertion protein NarJ
MSGSGGQRNRTRSLEALSQAAAWRLAGLLFERPRPGWQQDVEALSKEVANPALKSAARDSCEGGEGLYLGLLGPGGTVSPREAAYRPKEDPGQVLADIAGFYSAFSFAPRTEDPIDHVSVEANFAGYLCLKTAYALEEGNPEAADTARRALQLFAEEHLEPFARALAGRLEGSGPAYLGRAARALAHLSASSKAP